MNDYKSKTDLMYKSVNELWKDVKIPYITRYEVRKALDKLTFVFGKKRFAPPHIRYNQQKPRIVKSMICLSGNPETLNKGWRDLIHTFSHWNYDYRNGYTNRFNHSLTQAELEFEITKIVISSGWLEGGLKPKVVVLSKDEKRLEKIKHLQNLIEKWQRKLKIANTFIRKYHKKLKYHTKK